MQYQYKLGGMERTPSGVVLETSEHEREQRNKITAVRHIEATEIVKIPSPQIHERGWKRIFVHMSKHEGNVTPWVQNHDGGPGLCAALADIWPQAA